MIKIDNEKTIEINRGDKANINLTANDGKYQFEAGDIIKLRIYNKNGYDQNTLLEKESIVSNQNNNVVIELNETDTEFVPKTDKKIVYWYDISLNESTTIIGYDENGPKKFIVYPAKIGGEA